MSEQSSQTRPGMKEAMELLRERNLHALTQERCQSTIRNAIERAWLVRGRAVVVGAGGSRAAATHIARSLEAAGWAAEARAPYDHCLRRSEHDLLVCVSYSGQSADIAAAIEASAANGCATILLLTGNAEAPLAEHQDVSYSACWGENLPGGPERGFLSVAATTAPALVWSAATRPDNHEAIRTLAGAPNNGGDARRALSNWNTAASAGVLHVIGSGWAQAAMDDLESGAAESHLPWVIRHEAKDYSHGRYIDTMRTEAAGILMGVSAPGPYEQALSVACQAAGMKLNEIRSQHPGELGGLELLLSSKHLIAEMGNRAQLNLSRPENIPAEAKALHSWNSPLN